MATDPPHYGQHSADCYECEQRVPVPRDLNRDHVGAYLRGYQDGIARGQRSVADPSRFEVKHPDYTTLRNEKRE